MADNTQLPLPSTVGDVIAADDISGVKFQRIKLTLGADGVNDGDVSEANPLPIAGAQADGAASAGTGLVIAGVTGGGNVQILETNGSGHLHISDGGGSITVDGTFWQNTQPVSGTVSTNPASQTYLDVSFSQVISNGVQSEFTLVQTGSGMTVNQTGGNLVITAGTTTNSETIIRSVQTFTGNLTLFEVTTLSQRNANNNFYYELVDYPFGLTAQNYTIVNATTVDVTITAHGYGAGDIGRRMDIGAITGAAGIPMEAVVASIPNANTIRFTVAGWPASGSGTCLLWGLNKIETLYTGAGATTQNVLTRRLGYQNTTTGVASTTTAAAKITQMDWVDGDVQWSDNPITAATLNLAKRGEYRTNIPMPSVNFYLQIRAKNGTAAPTATTWTIGMVRIEGITAQKTSITAGRIGQGLPVNVIAAPTTTVTGTVSANSTAVASTVRAGFIAGAGIWFDDSATNLAGAATFTGTSRDLTVTATATAFANAATYAQELRVSAESDVTGTLWLEVSRDNTNWRRIKSVATTAVTGGGFYAEIVHRPSWRYARVGYTNGAGAQARFSIGSVLMAV